MSFHTHATSAHVSTQQPRTIAGGLLSCLDIFIGKVLEHQRISIPEETGIRRIAGNLVVEKQAPVVTVGHSEFTVGECKPVEHFSLHLFVVVHQCIGLPFLLTIKFLLEQFQGESSLAQFLHHHVLIRGVEVVMVLQCIVVVEVLPFVELRYGL